jgi:signal peptidase I
MVFDFAFILVAATATTGIIWAFDAWVLKPRRVEAAVSAGTPAEQVHEPVVVEYARSFFPIIAIVLIVRSFLFEPFRIPSDSMMPTLLDGDFIFVNKFMYGLRLPVVNTRIVPIGEPHRGDVVVFRLPSDPSTNYIKRLVGLPGDRITVRGKQLYVNGKVVTVEFDGIYAGHGATGAQIGLEHLGRVEHRVLFMPERITRDYDAVVPEGHYFFMGDNRDNSRDSRFPEVGFVPADHLVGKAVRIWLNWNLPQAPLWSRIGMKIQ